MSIYSVIKTIGRQLNLNYIHIVNTHKDAVRIKMNTICFFITLPSIKYTVQWLHYICIIFSRDKYYIFSVHNKRLSVNV